MNIKKDAFKSKMYPPSKGPPLELKKKQKHSN